MQICEFLRLSTEEFEVRMFKMSYPLDITAPQHGSFLSKSEKQMPLL